MKQIIRVSIVSFVLLLVTVVKYSQETKIVTIESSLPTIATGTTETAAAPTQKPISMAETVAGHNNPGDCWIIYQGQVYNITSYFGSHPGGDPLLAKYCGRDATTGFDTKEMAPGTPHSGAAKSILAGFLVKL